MYAPNIASPKFIKQILTDLKGETENNTVIVGDFSTPLSARNKSSRQKINKETKLNHRTKELNRHIRAVYPTETEYTFLFSAHEIFSRTDHMIGHKTNPSKFKMTETTSTIFSDHNGIKLGINKRETGKLTNMWKLYNMLLNNQCVKEEIKRK